MGRWVTAYSALIAAALWLLLAVFAVDVAFQMDVTQRVLVMAIVAAAGLVWSFRRYCGAGVGRSRRRNRTGPAGREEARRSTPTWWPRSNSSSRRPSPGARVNWRRGSSRALPIWPVSLDVFEGLAQPKPRRRTAALVATVVVVAAVAIAFPGHTRAFLQRLCLAAVHYPSDTVIEHIAINHQTVLDRTRHGSRPVNAKCAEGYPLDFWVCCSGVLPRDGKAQLMSAGDRKRPIELERMTLEARRERLQQAAKRPARGPGGQGHRFGRNLGAGNGHAGSRRCPWLPPTRSRRRPGTPPNCWKRPAQLDQLLKGWPGDAERVAVYAGQLPRLISPLTYQVYVGDGWTDPADVAMIPLPLVESQLIPVPPAYAKVANEKPAGTGRPADLRAGRLRGQGRDRMHQSEKIEFRVAYGTDPSGPSALRFDGPG